MRGRAWILAAVVLATVAIVGAAVIGIPWLQAQGPAGAAPRPQGIYVGRGVLGDSPVGKIVCAAVKLGDKSYSDGQATAYWWTTNNGDCQARASGITAQNATVDLVARPGSLLGARDAVRVAFEIQTTAGEQVELSFTLDPGGSASSEAAISTWRKTDTGKPSLVFERRSQLAIPGLEDDGPLPTPLSP